MANHGGEHVWDINRAQAKDALYVRTLPTQMMMRTNDFDIVVQHRISRIRFRHPPHKVVGTIPLSTSLLTRAMESI